MDCIDIEYSVGEVADSETCPQEGRAEFLIMLHVVPEGAKKHQKTKVFLSKSVIQKK